MYRMINPNPNPNPNPHLLPRIGWSVETAAPQLLVEPGVVEVVGGKAKGGAVLNNRVTQHVEAERALVRSVDADLS